MVYVSDLGTALQRSLLAFNMWAHARHLNECFDIFDVKHQHDEQGPFLTYGINNMSRLGLRDKSSWPKLRNESVDMDVRYWYPMNRGFDVGSE